MDNQNEVQFTKHAVQRVMGRYRQVTSYGQVQTVLINKPLRNGTQHVLISTLSEVVTILDPTARDGRVTGNKICAVVEAKDNEVNVITITLEK